MGLRNGEVSLIRAVWDVVRVGQLVREGVIEHGIINDRLRLTSRLSGRLIVGPEEMISMYILRAGGCRCRTKRPRLGSPVKRRRKKLLAATGTTARAKAPVPRELPTNRYRGQAVA